ADEPGRPRLHQAPNAPGGRRVRRRGLRPLLLPRLLTGRLRRHPLPADARARLEEGQEAVGDPETVPRSLLHHRRAQHSRVRRRAQAAGAQGALRLRGRDLPPRRNLDHRFRLAHERAPLEHRAAAPPEPRGALRGADGAQARRGPRRDQFLGPGSYERKIRPPPYGGAPARPERCARIVHKGESMSRWLGVLAACAAALIAAPGAGAHTDYFMPACDTMAQPTDDTGGGLTYDSGGWYDRQ